MEHFERIETVSIETGVEMGTADGYVTTWAGTIHVSASAAGVRAVNLPRWTERTEPLAAEYAVVVERGADAAAARVLRLALDELAEYFAGQRRAFTVPLDLSGPEFYQRVWREVADLPFGETCSYGEIARALGAPQASRAVGAANGANPVAPFVPCHRIVGSGGRLTGYGPGLPLKQRLLVMEGAMPASQSSDDYAAWTQRVGQRLHTAEWFIGARSTGIYCRPSCSAARRLLPRPNALFAGSVDAEAAGYRPCRLCLAA